MGRTFPQAVYFPIRTLYLTLKIEQRERHKTSGQGGSAAAASAGSASADAASVAGKRAAGTSLYARKLTLMHVSQVICTTPY